MGILFSRKESEDSTGKITHFQALTSAIAGTVGMGNISGVAIAITTGGPGAIFWMWVSAFVGMITKFFTCSLAVMYRKGSEEETVGGPMYVIVNGLGSSWKPMASLFAFAGMFGCLSLFQANQLTEVIVDVYGAGTSVLPTNLKVICGLLIMITGGVVILGGLKRIVRVNEKLVPFMVILYTISVLAILVLHADKLAESIELIFIDAFTAKSVLGGALGSLIIIGAKRAAFSNEAGIGTAPMIHGDTKTDEPIKEGLVAMLGPAIDTLLVCTMTALAILVTDSWNSTNTIKGAIITITAFETTFSQIGLIIILICIFSFSLSTIFSISYYGEKCFSFLFGNRYVKLYKLFYILTLYVGAVITIKVAINFIDGMYAVMAFPTMISTLILAPKVREESKKYFNKLKNRSFGLQ